MKLSDILAPLIAAKVPHDVILDTVRAYEAAQDATVDEGKEKARERWRRWKARQPETNVSKRLQTAANVSKPLMREDARVEDNLQTENSTGQKENKKNTRASDEAAFRADLSTDLPAELLDGVVKLRREKRGQVTALSARLFRDDAAACGMSVSDAAQACVSRNWITVKPEYFRDRQHRGQGPPSKGDPFAALANISRAKGWTTDEPDRLSGNNQDDQRVPPERAEHRGAVVDLRRGPSGDFGLGDRRDGTAFPPQRNS